MTNISTVYNAIAIATTDNTRLITSECYRSTLILYQQFIMQLP